ncbi:MAG: EamA domain-containing protein [Burkholderia sp.]|jgi:drug/metabolite transporter (DMT)-like permease
MVLGVLLGIAAGALWGLIYIAPLMLPEYNPVLIALGRFIAFGIVSLPALWLLRDDIRKFSKEDIVESFRLPFIGNVIFYCLLTTCIRLAGAPLAGMFMAVIPVLVAVVSNFRYRQAGGGFSWGAVCPPLVFIFFGLVVANWTEFQYMTAGRESPMEFAAGVGFGVAAVIAWTWFSIENGEWLLAHPDHSTSAWTALQGVTVLPAVLAIFALAAWGFGWMDTSETLLGPRPLRFLGVALMIGFLCSWVAMLCWNQMSQRLPSALGGQLIVFESISSVAYAHLWRAQWPTPTMVLGFSIVLIGVIGSLYVFRNPPPPKEAALQADD